MKNLKFITIFAVLSLSLGLSAMESNNNDSGQTKQIRTVRTKEINKSFGYLSKLPDKVILDILDIALMILEKESKDPKKAYKELLEKVGNKHGYLFNLIVSPNN